MDADHVVVGSSSSASHYHPEGTIMNMMDEQQFSRMVISDPEADNTQHAEMEDVRSNSPMSDEEQPGNNHDGRGTRAAADGVNSIASASTNNNQKSSAVQTKGQQDTVQKVKVMHEILDRKLKKAEEQKTYLFQERANKRRSFNNLRRSLSSNNKSELGDETTLEQMRLQLEALREEKEHVEDEIEKTQERLTELTIIKESPEEKAARLDELCNLVTKEFASRRKPMYEA